MTAQLSWHVQNFVAITLSEFRLQQNVRSQILDYEWKNISEMGRWVTLRDPFIIHLE